MSRPARNQTVSRRVLVMFAGQTTRPSDITRDEWARVKSVRRANAKARKAQRQRVRASRRAS